MFNWLSLFEDLHPSLFIVWWCLFLGLFEIAIFSTCKFAKVWFRGGSQSVFRDLDVGRVQYVCLFMFLRPDFRWIGEIWSPHWVPAVIHSSQDDPPGHGGLCLCHLVQLQSPASRQRLRVVGGLVSSGFRFSGCFWVGELHKESTCGVMDGPWSLKRLERLKHVKGLISCLSWGVYPAIGGSHWSAGSTRAAPCATLSWNNASQHSQPKADRCVVR